MKKPGVTRRVLLNEYPEGLPEERSSLGDPNDLIQEQAANNVFAPFLTCQTNTPLPTWPLQKAPVPDGPFRVGRHTWTTASLQ